MRWSKGMTQYWLAELKSKAWGLKLHLSQKNNKKQNWGGVRRDKANTVEGLGDQRETTSSSTPLSFHRIQIPFERPQTPSPCASLHRQHRQRRWRCRHVPRRRAPIGGARRRSRCGESGLGRGRRRRGRGWGEGRWGGGRGWICARWRAKGGGRRGGRRIWGKKAWLREWGSTVVWWRWRWRWSLKKVRSWHTKMNEGWV